VTEQDRHEQYQANAPQVAAGLYLVPRSSSEAGVSDWHTSTLTQLAAGLRARKFSSVELVRACLARIDASQAALNAFISVTREQALADAAAADRALTAGSGGARSPACRSRTGHFLHPGRTHHLRFAHAG